MSSNLRGRSIVLIGGAGFIGHHLALKTKELGADVHVVDKLLNKGVGALYTMFAGQRLNAFNAAGIPLHVFDACEPG